MEGQLSRALVAWVDAVRRHARGVLIATAVVTSVLLVYTAANFRINTHHTALLSDDLPFWNEYKAFAEVFPILDEALLVVVDAETPDLARDAADELAAHLARDTELYSDVYVPGGGEFFEKHALLYLGIDELGDLSDQLASVQPLLAEIVEDPSLQSLTTLLQEGVEQARTNPDMPLDLSVVFDSFSLAAAGVLEGRPRPVSWTELLLARELPVDSSRRLIVLHPNYEYDRLLPGRTVLQDVRHRAHVLGLVPEQGVTVRITGNVALNTEEMLSVTHGSVIGALCSFFLVGFILYAALRSRPLVSAILATLLIGLIWTAAFGTWAVGHVNVISIAFAVLFIGLGVDFGIHFGMRYAELLRSEHSQAAALADTARSVGGSLVLCAFTTAMGFYVFVPTDFRAVGELGLISGTGMILSLICTLTVLPALLAVSPNLDPGRVSRAVPWLERVLITLAVHHARTVRLVAGGLFVACLFAVPLLRFDHNVVTLRDPSTESVQTFAELLEDSDTSPWTIDILAPDLAAAASLAEALRELDVVERAVTLRDYVPADQEEKFEMLADLSYFLPDPPVEGAPARHFPIAEQVATLRALQESLRSSWIAEGDPERAESAVRAAAYLERFLSRLETLDRKQEELEKFEESLTGTLPDQLRRLWSAIDPGGITLETLPPSLVRRMVSPEGTARVQVLPRYDLGDNIEHARFVDTVKTVAPEATGSAVSLLEWGRAVVRSFREALSYAVIAVALLLRCCSPRCSPWRPRSPSASPSISPT
jgi:hopanoid biosynthesis associated RND transporter like protein HpnN